MWEKVLKHVSGKQVQPSVQTKKEVMSMVTQAKIVAQYIMTNSITAAADDMKVVKK